MQLKVRWCSFFVSLIVHVAKREGEIGVTVSVTMPEMRPSEMTFIHLES